MCLWLNETNSQGSWLFSSSVFWINNKTNTPFFSGRGIKDYVIFPAWNTRSLCSFSKWLHIKCNASSDCYIRQNCNIRGSCLWPAEPTSRWNRNSLKLLTVKALDIMIWSWEVETSGLVSDAITTMQCRYLYYNGYYLFFPYRVNSRYCRCRGHSSWLRMVSSAAETEASACRWLVLMAVCWVVGSQDF